MKIVKMFLRIGLFATGLGVLVVLWDRVFFGPTFTPTIDAITLIYAGVIIFLASAVILVIGANVNRQN